jgi:starch phosphorylase
LLPEALEKWPLHLFASVLPRHLEIIYEINKRFLDQVRQAFPGEDARVRNLSIIDEGGEKYVRMANLAVIGSHAVNGVAELHSALVKTQLFPDFYAFDPARFHHVTNGVTPRRFLLVSNPGLARLIHSRIGEGWVRRLDELKQLESLVDDAGFRRDWLAVKQTNKERLAALIETRCGISVDPASLFDVQVKRVHEYKRQHLNILHIITLYLRLRHDPKFTMAPRTFIFGGKAAPGYFMAKLIIKLVNAVAAAVNGDPRVKEQLKVVFFPDYNVKNAQQIYPAADLSEQISTAGKEASGTGNMKLALNGALTIGTLDGANIEIREEVGEENFFEFGMTASQVDRLREMGYSPADHYRGDPELKEVIDLIDCGFFSHGDTELFRPLTSHLLGRDDYFVLADYRAYVDCQHEVDHAYRDRDHWARMSILNVARCGKFSSDRAVAEYARDIWQISPITVSLDAEPESRPRGTAGCMGDPRA